MSERTTAEIVADLNHLVNVSDYNIKLHVEAADRLAALDAANQALTEALRRAAQ